MGAVIELSVLVVDDEQLARERLRQLLQELEVAGVSCQPDAQGALSWLDAHPVDVVLLDISMPGQSGMDLARALMRQPLPPQLVFCTAHEAFAVDAFELDAADYLLKPVRRERLRQALERAQRRRGDAPRAEPGFTVCLRDRRLVVPFSAARYLKAEYKYVTLVTADGEYLLDEPLVALEQQLGDSAVRIHRNCLVMRHALCELKRSEQDGEEQWVVRLRDIPQPLPVSRRQLAGLKSLL